MVRLTITEAMVMAIDFCRENKVQGWPLEQIEGEPLLDNSLQIGGPITHGQVIALSKCLQQQHQGAAVTKSPAVTYDLNSLLRGSKVYVGPPKPKKEPVSCLQDQLSARTDCFRRLNLKL